MTMVFRPRRARLGRHPTRVGAPAHPGRLLSIVLAAITFTQILEILALIAVVHVVLLAPFMLAGFLSWLEYHQNAKTRRLRSR
jgi:hypothetical protein